MALNTVGGGYQFNDGNLNEVKMSVAAAPATAVDTATLTVAQITCLAFHVVFQVDGV